MVDIEKTCLCCGIELHQRRLDSAFERSFPTCHTGRRNCEVCEAAFERRELPKKRVGIFAAPRRQQPLSGIGAVRTGIAKAKRSGWSFTCDAAGAPGATFTFVPKN